jgi:hypothetical protein
VSDDKIVHLSDKMRSKAATAPAGRGALPPRPTRLSLPAWNPS